MRALLVALLLAGCGTPDRWNAGVSRGAGELEGPQNDWETAETRLEIGVSGPIGEPARARKPEPAPPAAQKPAPVSDAGDVPWEALLLAVGAGAAGLKGTEAGYRRMRKRRPT